MTRADGLRVHEHSSRLFLRESGNTEKSGRARSGPVRGLQVRTIH